MADPVRTFKDLRVWQRSTDLVIDLYRLTGQYPRSELFVLTAATRRTAISIPSNIAEGASCGSTPAFINHLKIALGSEAELFTQIECGRRLGYVEDGESETLLEELSEIGRMLRGLVVSLETDIDRAEWR